MPSKTITAALLLALASSHAAASSSTNLRSRRRRQLAASRPYYATSDSNVLGKYNVDASLGNPMKGLLTSPQWTGSSADTPNAIPSSLEFHYLGLDTVYKGYGDYDWDFLDETIRDAESQNRHVMWRFYIHYPKKPLRLPGFLYDKVKLKNTSDGKSPDYNDDNLREALEEFIMALGERYDGHKSVAFIQLGLIGKWGEWHTWPDGGLLSDDTKEKYIKIWANAFKTTKLQVRSPLKSALEAGIGFHDDSFAYNTLGGHYNGGVEKSWYFWPKVKKADSTEFWKKSAMGGETRPEIQGDVFKPGYDAGTFEKQDYLQCVETTHATYMWHHDGFQGNGYSGEELKNARRAHASMGYNFQVTKVEVFQQSSKTVSIDVAVKQVGVAPFYYDLQLALNCDGTVETVGGVDNLVEPGDSDVFTFKNIPADSDCLSDIELTLESSYKMDGRPIKFAQGSNGKVKFSLPMPSGVVESEDDEDPIVEEEEEEEPEPEQEEEEEENEPKQEEEEEEIPEVSDVGTGFTLMDASKDKVLFDIDDGDKIYINDLDTSDLSIRANVASNANVEYVTFDYNGKTHREGAAPYAMGGNSGADYNPVDYLTYPGEKYVTVKVHLTNGPVDEQTVEFDMEEIVNSEEEEPEPEQEEEEEEEEPEPEEEPEEEEKDNTPPPTSDFSAWLAWFFNMLFGEQ